MSRHLIRLLWIAAALITYTGTAFASMPTGIIANVTSVQVLKTKPARVVITGAFKIVTDPVNYTYSAVQVGYMYFECPANEDKVCQMEWDDLRKVAGHATDCAMFGSL